MNNVTAAVPELKLYNAQLHAALQAEDALENAIFRAGNQDPLSVLQSAYRSPFVRTRLATLFRGLAPKEALPVPEGLVGGLDASGSRIVGQFSPLEPQPPAITPEVLPADLVC